MDSSGFFDVESDRLERACNRGRHMEIRRTRHAKRVSQRAAKKQGVAPTTKRTQKESVPSRICRNVVRSCIAHGRVEGDADMPKISFKAWGAKKPRAGRLLWVTVVNPAGAVCSEDEDWLDDFEELDIDDSGLKVCHDDCSTICDKSCPTDTQSEGDEHSTRWTVHRISKNVSLVPEEVPDICCTDRDGDNRAAEARLDAMQKAAIPAKRSAHVAGLRENEVDVARAELACSQAQAKAHTKAQKMVSVQVAGPEAQELLVQQEVVGEELRLQQEEGALVVLETDQLGRAKDVAPAALQSPALRPPDACEEGQVTVRRSRVEAMEEKRQEVLGSLLQGLKAQRLELEQRAASAECKLEKQLALRSIVPERKSAPVKSVSAIQEAKDVERQRVLKQRKLDDQQRRQLHRKQHMLDEALAEVQKERELQIEAARADVTQMKSKASAAVKAHAKAQRKAAIRQGAQIVESARLQAEAILKKQAEEAAEGAAILEEQISAEVAASDEPRPPLDVPVTNQADDNVLHATHSEFWDVPDSIMCDSWVVVG